MAWGLCGEDPTFSDCCDWRVLEMTKQSGSPAYANCDDSGSSAHYKTNSTSTTMLACSGSDYIWCGQSCLTTNSCRMELSKFALVCCDNNSTQIYYDELPYGGLVDACGIDWCIQNPVNSGDGMQEAFTPAGCDAGTLTLAFYENRSDLPGMTTTAQEYDDCTDCGDCPSPGGYAALSPLFLDALSGDPIMWA